MKKLMLLCLLSWISFQAQNDFSKQTNPIVAEGKKLYKSEMASWYGTDLFLAKYQNQDNIGGYFSYNDGDVTKCIFFSKADKPKVIGTMSFDSTYNVNTAKTDLTERDFTTTENNIYSIRKIALDEIKADTMFKMYKNTNLNIIPLIEGNDKKVYVLTGPQQAGVVVFGNDYLITFDKDNKIKSKKTLHANIIPVYTKTKESDNSKEVSAMHSHAEETGDFITATDICTLMLYSKYTEWKTHNVVSKKYLNIWNCQTNSLTVITLDAVKKINEDQEKRHGK